MGKAQPTRSETPPVFSHPGASVRSGRFEEASVGSAVKLPVLDDQWNRLNLWPPTIGYLLSQGSQGGTDVSGSDWLEAITLWADGMTTGGQWTTTGTFTQTSTGTCRQTARGTQTVL